jgi:hypothetical protein
MGFFVASFVQRGQLSRRILKATMRFESDDSSESMYAVLLCDRDKEFLSFSGPTRSDAAFD